MVGHSTAVVVAVSDAMLAEGDGSWVGDAEGGGWGRCGGGGGGRNVEIMWAGSDRANAMLLKVAVPFTKRKKRKVCRVSSAACHSININSIAMARMISVQQLTRWLWQLLGL